MFPDILKTQIKGSNSSLFRKLKFTQNPGQLELERGPGGAQIGAQIGAPGLDELENGGN